MINVLVTDPNPGFAAMMQQVLEETGRFNVTVVGSGADAIAAASRATFDIVIVELAIEDFSLRDLVTVLRRAQPHLPVMVVLPFGEQALPDAAKFFDVQGILAKPIYIPDLQKNIDEALTKSVNGVVPPPRVAEPPAPPAPVKPITAAARTGELKPTTPKKAAPPAPAWLQDVNRAAQYLTSLTLESSAEAALLMRGQQLIAFAGQCSKADADELATIVAANWAKDGDSSQGAQVRFLRLSSGADYLVYSTLAAQEVVLSMAFQAETPLGQIRKQAKRATEALITPTEPPPPATPPPASKPDSDQPILLPPASSDLLSTQSTKPFYSDPAEAALGQPKTEMPPAEAKVVRPASERPRTTAPLSPVASAMPKTQPLLPNLPESSPDKVALKSIIQALERETDWSPITGAEQTDPSPYDWIPASELKAAAVETAAPPVEADVEPIPDEDSLNALSQQLLQLEQQALVEQPLPLELPPVPLVNIRRTPHGLYDLSYTFLILPRLAHITLTGELKDRLEQWLIVIADTHDWEANQITVADDHIEISLKCPPADSPERIIKTLLAETSEKVLNEFPRLAASHSKRPGAFWASGYYVVTPGRHLTPEEVQAFMQYQRREQSGGKL